MRVADEDRPPISLDGGCARRRQFDRLPISLAAAVLETLGAIVENPKRLGRPADALTRGSLLSAARSLPDQLRN